MPALIDAPYVNAPSWCFLFTELSVCAFMIASAIHAYRRRGAALAYLLGGMALGFLLEYFEVISGSYTYGRFLLMFGRAPLDVPIFVGLAWGVIMYTARLFSDWIGLPMVTAAFDTLLALSIDLGMDAVIYRMHFWNWDWSGTGRNPLTADWFGIPYGNFVGWITVVFCCSLFSRLFEQWLLRRHSTVARVWSVPVLATVCSLGILVSTEMLLFPVLTHFGIRSCQRLLILTALLLFFSLRGWRQRRQSAEKLHPLAKWVPGWFHIFFVYCFFALGFYRENKWMTIATGLNLLIGIAVHCFPMRSCSGSQVAMAKTQFGAAPDAFDVQPSLVSDRA